MSEITCPCAEIDMLRERERHCPTMLEAESRALKMALQIIADKTGMLPSASPRQIVERVIALMDERQTRTIPCPHKRTTALQCQADCPECHGKGTITVGVV